MALDSYVAQPTGTANPLARRDNNAMVQDSLESFMNPNSSYIKNARQRGMEVAATRGGINSSIAAGASERAAIDSAGPLVQQSLALQSQQDAADLSEWQSQQGFNRDMYGAKFQNSLGMLSAVSNMALQDPELYTPEVTSGLSNFFQQNMNDIFAQYFPQGAPRP